VQLSYTDEEAMLADQARRYLDDRYPFSGRRSRLAAGGLDPQVWQDFARFGWLGLCSPDTFEGAAPLLLALAEELGRALVTEPFVTCAVESAAILGALSESEVARALASDIASGQAVILIAHAEAGAGYDPHHVECRAVAATDGRFRLSGRKVRVAHAGRADVFLVTAREAGRAREADGISLFRVEASQVALDGPEKLLLDGTPARDLVLDGVEVTAADRLGQPGGAAAAIDSAREKAILALTGMSLGAMAALVEQTALYLETRVQFDRPLSSFQALRHRLSDMVISVERARSAAWAAVNAVAAGGRDAARGIAVAKVECARAGRSIAQDAVQLHGAVGTTEELKIGHYLRFLEMTGVRFGNRAYHLATITEQLRTQAHRGRQH